MAEDNNFNITPDMINNLANMLNSSNSSAENINLNQFSSILENFGAKSSSNESNSSNTSKNSTNNIDFDTILKLKSIMENLNSKDDPRSNLLYSLKPYLRENRQKKLDQYVNLLKITKITDLLKNEKGDEF